VEGISKILWGTVDACIGQGRDKDEQAAAGESTLQFQLVPQVLHVGMKMGWRTGIIIEQTS
jgi:hypothetical protein